MHALGRMERLARSGEADAVLQTNLPRIINGCITPPSWLGRAAAGQRRGNPLRVPAPGSGAAAGTRKGTCWLLSMGERKVGCSERDKKKRKKK